MAKHSAQTSRTKKWRAEKAAFLAALRRIGIVGTAAAECKIPRASVYEWREKDDKFAADWDDALEDAVDDLEKEAIRRATVGVTKPVYQGGALVGGIQEHSDGLLMFMLKARRPERFRERVELGVKDGQALTGVMLIPGVATPENWAALVAKNTPPKKDG